MYSHTLDAQERSADFKVFKVQRVRYTEFTNNSFVRFPIFMKKECVVNVPILFLIFRKVFLVYSNPEIRVPRDSKIQQSWDLEIFEPHIIKPKFYETQIDQNNSLVLLNLLFDNIFHESGQTNAKHRLIVLHCFLQNKFKNRNHPPHHY